MEAIPQLYLISALAFLAILALVEGLWMLWRALSIPTNVRISRRLHRLYESGIPTAESISILRGHNLSNIPALNNLLDYIPRIYVLEQFLDQAGLSITVARYIVMQLGIFLAVSITMLVFGVPWGLALFAGALVGMLLPVLYVNNRREARRVRFSQQLPDTLEFLARSLRAGNPLTASFKAVSENMPEPTASEFGFTFNELNYGVTLEAALDHLGKRTGSPELRYFITAVLIQRTTGGNLAEILQRLAEIMRARERTRREIRIMSSEMRISANVLISLTFLIAGAISLVNPGYLDLLFTTQLGRIIIAVQLTLMAIGYGVVRRMISFAI